VESTVLGLGKSKALRRQARTATENSSSGGGLSPWRRARIQKCWNSTPPQSSPKAPKGCT
jgi:hypothetical protein